MFHAFEPARFLNITFSLHSFNRDCRSRIRFAAWGGLLAAALLGSGNPAAAQTRPATTTVLAMTSVSGPVTTVSSGSVVTLTATVKAGSTTLTTGQVNFCDAAAK